MPELVPRTAGAPVPRSTAHFLKGLTNETRVEHAVTYAITSVGSNAMFAAADVKRLHRELEQSFPEASEILNLIANSTNMAIAQQVHRFGQKMGG